MPNRFLRESITTSVSLSRLTAEEERLFYRLIVQADDFGCFQAHPSVIRAHGFALLLDTVSAEDCGRWIKALVKENIIHLYTGPDGKPYGHFVNWEKYQQRRAVNPKWPLPSCDITCNHLLAPDSSCEHVITDVPVSVSVSENVSVFENDKRERKPKRASQVSPALGLPEWIEQESWEAYMKLRKAKRATVTPESREMLIAQLTKFRESGDDPNEILRRSVMNGWTGIFQLATERSANGRTSRPEITVPDNPEDYRFFKEERHGASIPS